MANNSPTARAADKVEYCKNTTTPDAVSTTNKPIAMPMSGEALMSGLAAPVGGSIGGGGDGCGHERFPLVAGRLPVVQESVDEDEDEGIAEGSMMLQRSSSLLEANALGIK